MTMLTALSGGTHGILPNDIGALIVQPVRDKSIALRVASVVTTTSHEYRVPVLEGDGGAAWVAEGAEIPLTDAEMDEIVVVPSKVAGLRAISPSSSASRSLVPERILVPPASFRAVSREQGFGIVGAAGLDHFPFSGKLTSPVIQPLP